MKHSDSAELTEVITFRVSPADKITIAARAKLMRLSRSDFIRHMATHGESPYSSLQIKTQPSMAAVC